MKIDFLEGTLVEYKDGEYFNVELNRGKIREFGVLENIYNILADYGKCFLVSENILNIITDNKKCFLKSDLSMFPHYINKLGEVYYLKSPMISNHAIAQKGIEIPKKPDYE